MGLGAFERSPLFDSDERDYAAAGLPRPTMMLAGTSQQEVLDLIERGVQSDGSNPLVRGSLVFANMARSRPRDARWPREARGSCRQTRATRSVARA